LATTTEEYDHLHVNEDTGEQTTSRQQRPKLLWVVGPYWPVNVFITFPLILGISFLTVFRGLRGQSIAVIITWSLCMFTLLFALTMVACRDPGILYRHDQRPPGEDAESWRWNDQSRTYRPVKAKFDPECAVVIEDFDHTCPWTGTAIGARNMFWFKIFVWMLPVCIAYTIVIRLYF
jgi:hypothetical protein